MAYYEYRRVAYDDKRFAVVVIGNHVARVRRIDNELTARPIIWREGETPTPEIIAICERSTGKFK